MLQTLGSLPKIKTKLTVPLIASYLSCNYNITSIAKATGQERQGGYPVKYSYRLQ